MIHHLSPSFPMFALSAMSLCNLLSWLEHHIFNLQFIYNVSSTMYLQCIFNHVSSIYLQPCLLFQPKAIIFGSLFVIYWKTHNTLHPSSDGKTKMRECSDSSRPKRLQDCGELRRGMHLWHTRSWVGLWGKFYFDILQTPVWNAEDSCCRCCYDAVKNCH